MKFKDWLVFKCAEAIQDYVLRGESIIFKVGEILLRRGNPRLRHARRIKNLSGQVCLLAPWQSFHYVIDRCSKRLLRRHVDLFPDFILFGFSQRRTRSCRDNSRSRHARRIIIFLVTLIFLCRGNLNIVRLHPNWQIASWRWQFNQRVEFLTLVVMTINRSLHFLLIKPLYPHKHCLRHLLHYC